MRRVQNAVCRVQFAVCPCCPNSPLLYAAAIARVRAAALPLATLAVAAAALEGTGIHSCWR